MDGRILGAVLAGGLSTRFGTDKAEALLDGQRLLDRAVATLASQCDSVIVFGRVDPAHDCIPDWPEPGLGPLGGLAAALTHGLDQGYAAVLSCGVDSPGLPPDLARLLAPAPACVETQPVIGLWPTVAAAQLREIVTGPGSRSLRRFADAIGARRIALDRPPANINYPADLAAALRGE